MNKKETGKFDINLISQIIFNLDLFDFKISNQTIYKKILNISKSDINKSNINRSGYINLSDEGRLIENIDYFKKIVNNSFIEKEFLNSNYNFQLFYYSLLLLFYYGEFEFIENIINRNTGDNNDGNYIILKIIKLYYLFFSGKLDFFMEELENTFEGKQDNIEELLDFIKVLYYLKINIGSHIYLKQIIKLSPFFFNNSSFADRLFNVLKEKECFGTIYFLLKQKKVKVKLFDKDYFILIKVANGYYNKNNLLILKEKFKLYKFDSELLLNSKKFIKESFFKNKKIFEKLKFPYLKYQFLKKNIFISDKKNLKKLILYSISKDPGYKYFYPLLMYFYANNNEIDKIYKLESMFLKYFKHDSEVLKMMIKTFFKISDYKKTIYYLELFKRKGKDKEIENISNIIKKLTKT